MRLVWKRIRELFCIYTFDYQNVQIRYNLRTLIISAAQVERSKLRDKWKRVYYEENDSEGAHSFIKKEAAITRALRKSICMCEVCGTAKKDMVLSPDLETWFCVDCYELNRVYYQKTERGRLFPKIFCN